MRRNKKRILIFFAVVEMYSIVMKHACVWTRLVSSYVILNFMFVSQWHRSHESPEYNIYSARNQIRIDDLLNQSTEFNNEPPFRGHCIALLHNTIVCFGY